MRKKAGRKGGKRFNILIEGAGTATAISVLKGLAAQCDHDYSVLTTDMDGFVAGRYLSDKFIKTGLSTDKGYAEEMLRTCRRERIDLYVPIVDYGFMELSRNRRRFEEVGTYLMLADYESIRICSDKYETYRFLKKNGVPTPDTKVDVTDGEVAKLEYPAILKPRVNGRSSIDVHRIEGPDEFKFFTRGNDNYVLQNYISGMEFTADCLSSLDGGEFIDAVVRERTATKGGLAVKAKMLEYKGMTALRRHLKTVAERLRLPGAYNIQGFITDKGRLVFTEINPRFAGTHAFTVKAGLNSIKCILDMLEGATPKEVKKGLKINKDTQMVRYWNELFIDGKSATTWTNLIRQ